MTGHPSNRALGPEGTTVRLREMETRLMETILRFASFSQKNGNSLTWVLVALPVCPTSPLSLRLRDSAEPRPNLELASGNCDS